MNQQIIYLLNETQKVFDFVLNVKKSNRSVLFIGHNIYHVYDISDRFVILDRGGSSS